MMPSLLDLDLKGNIFRRTIYPSSAVVIALTVLEGEIRMKLIANYCILMRFSSAKLALAQMISYVLLYT